MKISHIHLFASSPREALFLISGNAARTLLEIMLFCKGLFLCGATVTSIGQWHFGAGGKIIAGLTSSPPAKSSDNPSVHETIFLSSRVKTTVLSWGYPFPHGPKDYFLGGFKSALRRCREHRSMAGVHPTIP